MSGTAAVLLTGAVSLFTNLPLGWIREGYRRLSLPWLMTVHASIPLVVALRILLDVAWKWVPGIIGLAILGQLIGGRLRRRKALSDSGDSRR